MRTNLSVRTSTSLIGCFLLATLAMADTANVQLIYDDSKNPQPFERVYFAANFDPISGEYSEGWKDFNRYPMYDDGAHQDGEAGDHIWGVVARVNPSPNQDFRWATDSDADKDNGWLASHEPFFVKNSASLSLTARSMPEEAYLTTRELEEKYGVDLSEPQAPGRTLNGDRVLITYHSPTARAVYLAGTFNNWADNQDGEIKNKRAQMYRAPSGLWYRFLPIPESDFDYKFATLHSDGKYRWQGDPLGPETDADGNTRIKISELKPIKTKPQETARKGSDISWAPYAHERALDLIKSQGRVLIYVRQDVHPMTESFEEILLNNPAVLKMLSGETILFANSENDIIPASIKEKGVNETPALLYRTMDSTWKSMTYTERTKPEDVVLFLTNYYSSS